METKASNATVTVVDIFANKIFPVMMPMLLQRQTCGEKQKCTANQSYKTFYNPISKNCALNWTAQTGFACYAVRFK
jgi:hypothetical protein